MRSCLFREFPLFLDRRASSLMPSLHRLQRVLHAMLCSRILLNLRKYGRSSAHTYNSEVSTAGVIGGPNTMPSGVRIHRVTEVSRGFGSKDDEEYELRPQNVHDTKYDLDRNPRPYDSFLERA